MYESRRNSLGALLAVADGATHPNGERDHAGDNQEHDDDSGPFDRLRHDAYDAAPGTSAVTTSCMAPPRLVLEKHDCEQNQSFPSRRGDRLSSLEPQLAQREKPRIGRSLGATPRVGNHRASSRDLPLGQSSPEPAADAGGQFSPRRMRVCRAEVDCQLAATLNTTLTQKPGQQ
jgi:hypothetical protein